MKRLLFVILSLAIQNCFAQFEKGNLLVGGNIDFSATTQKLKASGTTSTIGKITELGLALNGGYFIINKLAVGAGISQSLKIEKPDGSSGKTTTTGFSFDPFARYYFGPVYGQVQFGVGTGNKKVDSGTSTTETKRSIFKWSALVGYPIFLNASKSVALEPGVGFQSKIETIDTTGKPKDLYGSIFLRAGLQVYISRK